MSKIKEKKMKNKYDYKFKIVLSKKIFLARIMKECLEEYKELKILEIIKLIENHIYVCTKKVHDTISGANIEKNEDDKTTTYDINFFAKLPNSNEKISIIINIEIQTELPKYSILKRAHYYNARNISYGKYLVM